VVAPLGTIASAWSALGTLASDVLHVREKAVGCLTRTTPRRSVASSKNSKPREQNSISDYKGENMKIRAKHTEEKKVLESVKKNADPAKIHASIVAKAECCVDHLCGCKK
jgi:hypothetical protein